MGQKNSTLNNLNRISKNTTNCDKECQKNKKINYLNKEKHKAGLGNNYLNQRLKELDIRLNELKYNPNQLESIKFRNNMNIINTETIRFGVLFNQLLKELNTRINLYLIQYKFHHKNNIVLSDLSNQSKITESKIKKKEIEFNKNDRIINNIQKDTSTLENSLNSKVLFLKILFVVIILQIGSYIYLKKMTYVGSSAVASAMASVTASVAASV